MEPISKKRKECDTLAAGTPPLAPPPHHQHQLGNVFLNNVVMKKVACELGDADLLTLRSTCPLWNSAMVRELRCRDEHVYLNHAENGPAQQVEGYTDLMAMASTGHGIPFTKYKMDISNTAPDAFDGFFAVCGESITNLKIRFHGSVDAPVIDRMRRMIFQLTPNMTALRLSIMQEGPVSEPAALATDDLVEPTPDPENPDQKEHDEAAAATALKLKTLVIHFGSDQLVQPLQKPLAELTADIISRSRGLENVRNKSSAYTAALVRVLRDNPIHLKSMDLVGLKAADLGILTDMATRKQNPLQLRALTIRQLMDHDQPEDEDPPVEAIWRFLAAEGSSIRSLSILTICSEEQLSSLILHLPKMEAVKQLELNSEHFSFRFEGGPLSNAFPRLKGLVLLADSGKPLFGPDEDFRHDGVRKLTLRMGAGEMTRIAAMLPNVASLNIDLFGEAMGGAFPATWTAWPDLEVLRILYCTKRDGSSPEIDLDRLLSGISPGNLQALLQTLDGINLSAKPTADVLEYLRALQHEHKTEAGVSDLRRLKSLTICVRGRCKLTNAGELIGLAMASPNIQQLTIGALEFWTHLPAMSAECETFIGRALGGECESPNVLMIDLDDFVVE